MQRKICKTLVLSMLVFLVVVGIQKAGQAAEPVKIGYMLPFSGAFAAIGGDLRDGLNLYMEQIGYKSGGRDIKVVIEDEGTNDVSRAMDVARKLVEKDRVDLIAGLASSGSAYAVADFLQKNKIPHVISNAGADDLTQRKANPLMVRPAFVNSAGSHPLGVWAYEQGYRKAVAMGSDYAAGYEHLGGICNTFTKMGGKIIQEIWPPLGTKDFAPYLTKISREADVVMVFFAGADALRFVTQYEEYGLKNKIPLIGKGFLVDDNILPKQGSAAEGIVTESHWCYLLDTPDNKDFIAAYSKKYGHKPTLYSEQGYATGKLIAEALKITKGEIKDEAFVKVMRSVELKAPRGLVKFDKYGAPIQASYIRKVAMSGGELNNVPFKTYPSVSQFWTWSPEEYMKMPSYTDMKGKWVR